MRLRDSANAPTMAVTVACQCKHRKKWDCPRTYITVGSPPEQELLSRNQIDNLNKVKHFFPTSAPVSITD